MFKIEPHVYSIKHHQRYDWNSLLSSNMVSWLGERQVDVHVNYIYIFTELPLHFYVWPVELGIIGADIGW